jgi:hypothetical protein
MAEPARQLRDEESDSTYDAPGNAPSDPRAHLRVVEGGGETTDPKRGHLRDASEPEDIKEKEESPDEPESFYHPHGRHLTKNRSLRDRVAHLDRRKKIIYGGSIVAGILGTVIAFFIFFLTLGPLKIQLMVQSIQNRFYSTSENAMSKEQGRLINDYLRKRVFPGLRACKGTTIDPSCRVKSKNSTNPVGKLYDVWSEGRLENKIALNTGMQFGYKNGSYYMLIRDIPDEFNLDDFNDHKVDNFWDSSSLKKYDSRSEFRQAVKATLDSQLENQNRWKAVMYRYKVHSLLSRKGILPRCIVACKARDDFSDWKKDKKNAAKYALAQTVLSERDQMLRMVLACLWDQTDTNCKTIPEPKPAETDPESGFCASSCSAPDSPFSAEMENTLKSIDIPGLDDAAKIATAKEMYQQLSKKGFSRYVAEQMIQKTLDHFAKDKGGQATQELSEKIASDYIPIIGYILALAQFTHDVDTIAQVVDDYGYLVNTTSMEQVFNMYRVYADETKTGNVDPAIVGSLTASLGAGNQDPDNPDDPPVGGTAEAEQTPLYNYLLGDHTIKASKTYKCNDNDGKEVSLPAGKLVCPEEVVTNQSKFVNFDQKLKSAPFWDQLSSLGGAVDELYGYVSQGLGILKSAICKLVPTGVCSALQGVLGKIASLALRYSGIGEVAQKLFNEYLMPPNPVSTNMSGGRTFDMIAGGGDVSGNDYAHNGLGGVKLNDQQLTAILTEQQQTQRYNDSQKSIIARTFDTSSQNSLISKMALAMPASATSALSRLTNIFTNNPLGRLANSFSSMFTLNHAYAAVAVDDPFGVSQYGYPTDDPIFNQDPEEYWNQHCTSTKETDAWNNQAVSYANNHRTLHIPENLQPSQSGKASVTGDPKGTNPCLLIQAAVGSGGAVYDANLLSPDDDTSEASGGGGGASCDSPGYAPFDPGEWNKIPANIQALIEANAPTRTDKGAACGAIPNAHPSDPTKMYMGEFHYTAAGGFDWAHEVPAACESLPKDSGGPDHQGHHCIGIKYRDPLAGQRSLAVPID